MLGKFVGSRFLGLIFRDFGLRGLGWLLGVFFLISVFGDFVIDGFLSVI